MTALLTIFMATIGYILALVIGPVLLVCAGFVLFYLTYTICSIVKWAIRRFL